MEMVPISEDSDYNVDSQTARYVRPHREIVPGDSMQLVCNYVTTTRSTFIEVSQLWN